MRRKYVILFFASFIQSQAVLFTPDETIVDVTTQLLKSFSSNCLKILITENNSMFLKTRIVNIIRGLYGQDVYNVAIGTYNFQQFTNTYKTSCNNPLVLLLGDDEETKREFQNITNRVDVSQDSWLIFAETNDFFVDVNTPFNARMLVAQPVDNSVFSLDYVYRVDPSYPLRTQIFGNWSRESGIHTEDLEMYKTRSDLEGLLLKTGSVENIPFIYYKESEGKWTGYFYDIWIQLQRLLNCTSVHIRSTENMTGGDTVSGSWNGLFGMALRREIDIIVSDLTMTVKRIRDFDLTKPVLASGYQLYFKNPGYNLEWSAFLKPFGARVWMAVLIWIIIGGIVFKLCTNIMLLRNLEHSIQPNPTYLDTLFFMLKTLCQQGHHQTPSCVSCRIIFFTAYLASTVLIPSYSASLISYLTSLTPETPFDSWESFVKLKTYKLSTVRNTAEYTYFTHATDPVLETISNEILLPEDELPTSTRDGILELCYEYNKVFFGIIFEADIQVNEYNNNHLCSIMSMSKQIGKVYLSFGLVKGNPYTAVINYHLQRMRDFGLVKRLQYRSLPLMKSRFSAGWTAVSVYEVFQIFVLLLVGMCSSVLILAIEVLVNRRKQKDIVKDYSVTSSGHFAK